MSDSATRIKPRTCPPSNPHPGSLELVNALLKASADPNIRNTKNLNAAASAATAGFFDILLRLVEAGGMWRSKGEVDVVKLLCKKTSLK